MKSDTLTKDAYVKYLIKQNADLKELNIYIFKQLNIYKLFNIFFQS